MFLGIMNHKPKHYEPVLAIINKYDPLVNVYITMENPPMLLMGKSPLFRLGHFQVRFLYARPGMSSIHHY